MASKNRRFGLLHVIDYFKQNKQFAAMPEQWNITTLEDDKFEYASNYLEQNTKAWHL